MRERERERERDTCTRAHVTRWDFSISERFSVAGNYFLRIFKVSVTIDFRPDNFITTLSLVVLCPVRLISGYLVCLERNELLFVVGWLAVFLLSECLLVVLGRTVVRLITQIPNDQAFRKIRLLSDLSILLSRFNVFVSTQCRFIFRHYRTNVCCKFRTNWNIWILS